jgi:uncharacterized membrane protein
MYGINCIAPVKIGATTSAETAGSWGEMSRLISAALIDPRFCNLLLAEPLVAIALGYNGETFNLTAREKRFVQTVQAQSLTDFAVHWMRNRDGYG